MNNTSVFEKLKRIREFHSTPAMWGGDISDGNFGTGNIKVLYSSDPSQHQKWFAYVNSNASAIMFPLDDPIQSVFPKTIWESAQKAYKKHNVANDLRISGRYDDAEILYWESLEIQSTPEAFADLAHVFLVQERYNDAILVCYRGLKTTRVFINDGMIYTDDFDIFGILYSNLGFAMQSLMKFQEAEQALRKSIAINPNIATTHFNLAVLLANQYRLEEAEEAYRKVIAINPNDASSYLNLSIVLANQERSKESHDMLRKAHQLDTKLVNNFLNHRK